MKIRTFWISTDKRFRKYDDVSAALARISNQIDCFEKGSGRISGNRSRLHDRRDKLSHYLSLPHCFLLK